MPDRSHPLGSKAKAAAVVAVSHDGSPAIVRALRHFGRSSESVKKQLAGGPSERRALGTELAERFAARGMPTAEYAKHVFAFNTALLTVPGDVIKPPGFKDGDGRWPSSGYDKDTQWARRALSAVVRAAPGMDGDDLAAFEECLGKAIQEARNSRYTLTTTGDPVKTREANEKRKTWRETHESDHEDVVKRRNAANRKTSRAFREEKIVQLTDSGLLDIYEKNIDRLLGANGIVLLDIQSLAAAPMSALKFNAAHVGRTLFSMLRLKMIHVPGQPELSGDADADDKAVYSFVQAIVGEGGDVRLQEKAGAAIRCGALRTEPLVRDNGEGLAWTRNPAGAVGVQPCLGDAALSGHLARVQTAADRAALGADGTIELNRQELASMGYAPRRAGAPSRRFLQRATARGGGGDG